MRMRLNFAYIEMMLMRRICFAFILLFQTFSLVAHRPATVLDVENKPFVRWWWLGSAVDEEGLTWNLEEFARAGIGGVEITPIYGVKNNEKNDVVYLSPRWMELYIHTVKEAARLGLQVDMNNGTGWPFGGPHISTDYSAGKFISHKFDVKGGTPVSRTLALKDKRQKDNAVVQCVLAVGKSGREDITACVSGKERASDGLFLARSAALEWTPQEDAAVYVLYKGHTYQKVKRAAPGGEGLVMNHYDADALEHYLECFEKAFSESGAPWPDTFFNDSFEVYGSDWTGGFLEEFSKDHGYRLESMLPEFLGEGDPEISARVVTDYRETLARLLEENFTRPWTAWAHSHGVRTRNQAHGSPANIIDLYAAVDIPECESFGRSEFNIPGLRQDPILKPNDGDPAVLKFASSAAHLTGKKHTSAEALTWLTEHFRTSLSQCKPEIDQMFASGVNHIYFHGAPYSPKGSSFPGWKFYAAINMSPTNNIWNHAPAFFEYITRCQAFLSEGSPDNEVLLYLPIHDIWHEQQQRQFLIFDIHKMDKTMPAVKEAMNTIVRSGYDADYISDRFIQELSFRKGRLVTQSAAQYKALVVPECHKMPLETLNKLAELSRKGAKIIFIGNMPDDVPGYGSLEARRAHMKKILRSMEDKVTIGTDYSALLKTAGSVREPFKCDMQGTMVRQRNAEGGYDYFMSMLADNPVYGYVPLGAELPKRWGGTVWVSDPMTDRWEIADHRFEDGRLSVYLNLDPGESVLVRIVPSEYKAQERSIRHQAYRLEKEILMAGPWTLTFPESDPEIDSLYTLNGLLPWTRIDDERLKINCGTGLYRTEFKTPEDYADAWLLDLGDVRESAQVRLNGKRIGTAFCVPFRMWIDKDDLKPAGEMNTLEIEVCNLPSNRIADYERRGVEWRIFKDANIASVTGAKKFSFGDWATDPSGLNSEVKLIAVSYK